MKVKCDTTKQNNNRLCTVNFRPIILNPWFKDLGDLLINVYQVDITEKLQRMFHVSGPPSMAK
jgi:hypothetical protein